MRIRAVTYVIPQQELELATSADVRLPGERAGCGTRYEFDHLSARFHEKIRAVIMTHVSYCRSGEAPTRPRTRLHAVLKIGPAPVSSFVMRGSCARHVPLAEEIGAK